MTKRPFISKALRYGPCVRRMSRQDKMSRINVRRKSS